MQAIERPDDAVEVEELTGGLVDLVPTVLVPEPIRRRNTPPLVFLEYEPVIRPKYMRGLRLADSPG